MLVLIEIWLKTCDRLGTRHRLANSPSGDLRDLFHEKFENLVSDICVTF